MLDTVLEIGKAFRNSSKALKHHRFIKECPQDTDRNRVLRLSIPVKKDLSFDINGITEIRDENIIRDKLYYLKAKTSDSDSAMRYVFGDIYYTLVKGKEGGSYRLSKSIKLGEKYLQEIKKLITDSRIDYDLVGGLLFKFLNEFNKNQKYIHNLLQYGSGLIEFLLKGQPDTQKRWTALLENETLLKTLASKNIFESIPENTRKKTYKKLFNVESIDWGKIESDNKKIEKLFTISANRIFLHFDFWGKSWYELGTELNLILEKMRSDFYEHVQNPEGYVLKKTLFKTLTSPDERSDWQFPNFNPAYRYRNKLFGSNDEALDLFYAVDYSERGIKGLNPIYKSDIKVVVLPRGKNLKAEHYEQFQDRNQNLDGVAEAEKIATVQNQPDMNDNLFVPLVENVAEEITQFDLIFSKQGGQSSPDVDLLELSGLEKSRLQEIAERIRRIKREVYSERETKIAQGLIPFSVTYSFLNILGGTTKDKKKYQSHLLKVLPQIYSGTYYRDPVLLPALIEVIEQDIRNEGQPKFTFLKYDFIFLTFIQNTLKEGENLMQIRNSLSYQLGLLLGKLAQPLKFEIKSFEKSYVGNLSRRITTLSDLIRFKVFIEEKLVIHEKTYPNIKEASLQLAEQVKAFEGRYDRHECAFGFFESYFHYEKN